MATRRRSSAVDFHKLNALDKRSCRAVSSGRGGVYAEADPGDAWSIVLAEVTLERCVEIEFGHYRLVGFRFAQANEAAAGMEVPSLVMSPRVKISISVTRGAPDLCRSSFDERHTFVLCLGQEVVPGPRLPNPSGRCAFRRSNSEVMMKR